MEFTVKITKKDIIIGVLILLLIGVVFSKFQAKAESEPTTENQLHYGMVDNDINYAIIYDQVHNVSYVTAELFGDKDTIQIEDYIYLKIDSCKKPLTKKRNIIQYEDKDSTKAIRS